MFAYCARRFNEIFGEGAASYVEVRDEFRGDELQAWLAFFERWDAEENARKAIKEHQSVMAAAAKAIR